MARREKVFVEILEERDWREGLTLIQRQALSRVSWDSVLLTTHIHEQHINDALAGDRDCALVVLSEVRERPRFTRKREKSLATDVNSVSKFARRVIRKTLLHGWRYHGSDGEELIVGLLHKYWTSCFQVSRLFRKVNQKTNFPDATVTRADLATNFCNIGLRGANARTRLPNRSPICKA